MKCCYRQLFYIALLMSVIKCVSAQAAVTPLITPPAPVKYFRVIKSDTDTRDYRYLMLSNNLKVLLISDPAVEKSAVALNVNAGSHQNPAHRPGLSHFVEHALFLGSEKYPVPDEFQTLIAQHGGDNVSITAAENTSYYFEIDNNYLEPALDRFAQFFIAPLFDANNIEHEKNIINAEYLARVQDDESRKWDVYRTLFNQENPAATFAEGNSYTLADNDEYSLRDDTVTFYQNYYSANLITLVLIGNKKLDELQKLVELRFNLIPDHNKIIDSNYPTLFSADGLPASINIKPANELRQLSVAFPIPHYAGQYQKKTWEFIAYLLGNESSGSMLSLLKNLGWAESLHAGEIFSNRKDGLFEISINLTKEGAKAKDQIVSVIFDYLKTVSTRGITDWRFTELKQIGELEFRFHEKQNIKDTVVELAQAMHEYLPQDILIGKYIYKDFDEELLKQSMTYLSKENALIVFTSPSAKVNALSTYYHAEYSFSKGIADVLDLKSAYHQKLSLPERNIFIPKNITVKAPSMLLQQQSQPGKNIPVLLIDGEQEKIWFLQDTLFHSPKAELNLRFKLPALNASLESAARAQLFIALVADQINEYSYPAAQAGLHFSIAANAQGFDLNVHGYTDKQSLLINKIVDVLAQSAFVSTRFEKIKEDLIRNWRNQDKNVGSDIVAKKISRLQLIPFWADSEYAEGLQSVSFEQFKVFASELLRGAKVDGLFYGNLYEQDAIKLMALIDHQLLQKKTNRLPQLTKILRPDIKEKKSLLYVYPWEQEVHALALYIQALTPTVDDSAHMLLLNQILRPSFQHYMHEKQLNYLVSTYSLPFKSIESSVFALKSANADAEILMADVNTFLANSVSYIGENFSSNKALLLARLNITPVSFEEQSDRYWQSILLNDKQFSRQQELINSVSKITIDSLQKYYESAFLQHNHRLWLTNYKLENIKDFDVIQNIAEYQQRQPAYLLP